MITSDDAKMQCAFSCASVANVASKLELKDCNAIISNSLVEILLENDALSVINDEVKLLKLDLIDPDSISSAVSLVSAEAV
jgi:hypothetical protein